MDEIEKLFRDVAHQLIDEIQAQGVQIADRTTMPFDDMGVAIANRFIDKHQAEYVAWALGMVKRLVAQLFARGYTPEQIRAALPPA